MKGKQFLCLLTIVSLIFSSCSKDNDNDYRDKYEGIYATDIIGLLILSYDDIFVPIKYNQNIVVNKHGVNQLLFVIGGEIITVIVDEEGNFTIPPESGPVELPLADDVLVTMDNMTIAASGTITSKTLHITETWSGDGILEIYGKKEPSEVSATIVYNGTKK